MRNNRSNLCVFLRSDSCPESCSVHGVGPLESFDSSSSMSLHHSPWVDLKSDTHYTLKRLRGVFTTRRFTNSRLPLTFTPSSRHLQILVILSYWASWSFWCIPHLPNKCAQLLPNYWAIVLSLTNLIGAVLPSRSLFSSRTPVQTF